MSEHTDEPGVTDPDDWEAHWKDFNASHAANPAQWYRYHLIRSALRDAGMGGDDRLVDFGCGPGSLLAELRSEWPGAVLRGIDRGETAVRFARTSVPNASVEVGDLVTGDIPEGWSGWASFGVCTEVLEHLDDPVVALRNIGRCLAPGATLVVTVPGGPRSHFDRHIGHRRHFSRALLTETLRDAGFVPEVVAGAGFPFFNLYKSLTVLAGSRLTGVAEQTTSDPGAATKAVARLFGAAFGISTRRGRLGWQRVAIARWNGRPTAQTG